MYLKTRCPGVVNLSGLLIPSANSKFNLYNIFAKISGLYNLARLLSKVQNETTVLKSLKLCSDKIRATMSIGSQDCGTDDP